MDVAVTYCICIWHLCIWAWNNYGSRCRFLGFACCMCIFSLTFCFLSEFQSVVLCWPVFLTCSADESTGIPAGVRGLDTGMNWGKEG